MSSVGIELRDSRRLTGPNLLADAPGAVIDGNIAGVSVDAFLVAWRTRARQMLELVGWDAESTAHRSYPGGATVFHSAPVDALYAGTEVNEWAWAAATADVCGALPAEAAEAAAQRLRTAIANESNPALLALQAAARERNVSFLSDDDEASVGTGTGCRRWPVSGLPDPADVPWHEVHDVPRVLVTGTNGKTTTVRLLASIARAAGRTVGFTCTDGIYVDGELVDAGDWAGPGGGRAVLRHPKVEVAILETARGGMLRRGLAVDRADGALVTNVAADHLGEWGVYTVEDVARAKLVVSRAVRHGAPLVVNADDPHLAPMAVGLDRPLTWIAVDAVDEARGRMGPEDTAWIAEEGWLCDVRGSVDTRLVELTEIPATLGGLAVHNISNALAAAALARAMALPDEAIRSGLIDFDPSPEHSPGRGNLFEVGGVRILVDFVHNGHGFAALGRMLDGIPSERLGLMLGHAGDRDDDAIRELARAAWDLHPDRVAIKELAPYLRGRPAGEIPRIIRDELSAQGCPEGLVSIHEDEVDATRTLLEWARKGDFLLLSTQSHRQEVLALVEGLRSAGWTPGDEAPPPLIP